DVLSVEVAHHYWFGHFNDSQTDCHRSDVDDRGPQGGPQAAVVIVLPFLGLFVHVDFATPELFAGRGEDHPMPSLFECVAKIAGQSESLIETGFRSRDIYQQPLIGLEIIALVDRTAAFKMGLDVSNETVGTGDAPGNPTNPGFPRHCWFERRHGAEVAVLRPEEFIAGLRFWKWLGGRRLSDRQLRPIAPLGSRNPEQRADPGHVASGHPELLRYLGHWLGPHQCVKLFSRNHIVPPAEVVANHWGTLRSYRGFELHVSLGYLIEQRLHGLLPTHAEGGQDGRRSP